MLETSTCYHTYMCPNKQHIYIFFVYTKMLFKSQFRVIYEDECDESK